MATRLPATDIVIIGLGWTGSIVAKSMTDAGFNVVAIERGPWRDTATDFPPNYSPDELRYAVRHDLFVRPTQTTLTFRNNTSQTALPIRAPGAHFRCPMAWVEPACTGMQRPGAFCRAISC